MSRDGNLLSCFCGFHDMIWWFGFHLVFWDFLKRAIVLLISDCLAADNNGVWGVSFMWKIKKI